VRGSVSERESEGEIGESETGGGQYFGWFLGSGDGG
jgi:hypothetical protein